MRSTTYTNAPVPAIIAALLLIPGLSVLPVAVAQPASDDDQRAQTEKTATADSAEGGQENDNDNGESPATEEGVVLSPFDYEASESISEDSSVSFPVDI